MERCQGAGCTNFVQVGTPTGDDLQRHRAGGVDELQLPGAGGRRGRQPGRLLQRRDRDDASAGRHDAAVGADGAGGDGREHDAGQPGVDGVDGQRRRDRVPGRAVPGGELHELRPGRHAGDARFSDTGLAANTTYRFRVRAADAAGNLSAYSSIVRRQRRRPTRHARARRPGLAATVAGPTQVDLAWTASTDNVGVTGYRVERCQGAGCTNFVEVGQPTGTTFSDTGLTASTIYRYRVRAADAAGNLSGYSQSPPRRHRRRRTRRRRLRRRG